MSWSVASSQKAYIVKLNSLTVKGNKGSTAIRLTFTPPSTADHSKLHSPGSTTLTFVNAHLAAFDEMVDKRNSDFQDLSKRLSFEGLGPPSSVSEAEGGDDHAVADTPPALTVGFPPPLSVYETDFLFWMVSSIKFSLALAQELIRTNPQIIQI